MQNNGWFIDLLLPVPGTYFNRFCKGERGSIFSDSELSQKVARFEARHRVVTPSYCMLYSAELQIRAMRHSAESTHNWDLPVNSQPFEKIFQPVDQWPKWDWFMKKTEGWKSCETIPLSRTLRRDPRTPQKIVFRKLQYSATKTLGLYCVGSIEKIIKEP
jgi:hypothetical protein